MTSRICVATIVLLGLAGATTLPLAAQTNLKATATGPTAVELTWTAAPGATSYVIQRAIGSTGLTRLAGNVSGSPYKDSSVPAGAALRYRVKALFSRVEPTLSNIASVTTPSASPNVAAAPPSAAPPSAAPPSAAPTPAATLSAAPPRAATLSAAPSRAAPPSAAPPPPAAAPSSPPGQPTVQAVLLPQPVLVTNYSLAPANVTPVNPSRLVANQSGEGKVQLSWDFIEGVSYYVLRGPGLPAGGTRVSGATTFTATGVPAGYQEWSVGSYYEPGAVSTPAAEFPKTGLMVSELVLSGWADLHTHPMVHLAFGGKLIHGGVDVGSPLPQDLSCKGRTNATSIEHALSDDRPSHGGKNWINFTCGDDLRAHHIIPGFQRANDALVTAGPSKPPALGYPEFLHWPKWNDITHQKMWFEWIRRARDGGLRVMVALATNNKTLGDAVSGPGDGPTDDKTSGDLQLTELKAFVGRHPDFMEVAYGPADVKRIVQSNRIAVVLGVELDNIGNFNLPELRPLMSGPAGYGIIAGEIQRLYTLGVRYVIPIHVIDNQFGGTAIYENGFNRSNLREAGHFWEIECAKNSDGITYTYNEEYDLVKAMAAFVKIGMDPFRRSGPGPDCSGPGKGPHRNARGLTLQGIFAIKEMMKRGMIVDIDHMSQYSADATLDLGEKFGYPIVSGHNGIRGYGSDHASENQRTQRQLQRISRLHGMFGLGTDGVHQSSWANQYEYALNIMGYQHSDTLNALYRVGAVAFGTDLNGLVQGPPPSRKGDVYPGWLEPSTSGSKTWRYSDDGVAHYGMMADFVRGVSLAPANTYGGRTTPGMTGSDLVNHHLNRNANYFWQMWQRIEARKGSVQ